MCYKYNKPIRSTKLNNNKLVTELDILFLILEVVRTLNIAINLLALLFFFKLLIQELCLLHVKDLNTCLFPSPIYYKNLAIDGANGGIMNLML